MEKTQHFPAHSPAFHKDDMPGTGVPETCTDASQKGTIMSRREVFTSAAAIAVPAVALATTAVAMVSIDSDAALMALNEEHARALIELTDYIDGLGGTDIPDDYEFPDDEVALRMVPIQARTLKGLAIKAKAYLHSSATIDRKNRDIPEPEEDGCVDEQLLYSILRDIIALGGVETRVWPDKEG